MEAEQAQLNPSFQRTIWKVGVFAMLLNIIASMALVAGLFWARSGHAAPKAAPKVIYPEKTELDFEGARIEGEIRNPGELYFQRRQEEKFGSLVQPRKHFRREILRDLMQTR